MISVLSANINYNSGKLKEQSRLVRRRCRKGVGNNRKGRHSTVKFFYNEFNFRSACHFKLEVL